MTDILTIGGIIGILLAILGIGKRFFERGRSKNVKEKAKDVAAKKKEAETQRSRNKISEERYKQRIKEIEEKEARLKQEIKDTEDINVPDPEVDDASADELARRLAEYTS